MDLMIATTALVVVGPVLAAAMAISRVLLGPQVLFRQRRGGHGGTTFELLKLRTMTEQRGADGELLADEERAHWWGNFLRRTSLDELPGLINVIAGDMSVVGPRPLFAVYLERYSPEQAQRHRVRPGLTGLAQTSGRNSLSWEDRFRLDNRYIDELSFFGDVRILVRTVREVVAGNGVHLSSVFEGSEDPGDRPASAVPPFGSHRTLANGTAGAPDMTNINTERRAV